MLASCQDFMNRRFNRANTNPRADLFYASFFRFFFWGHLHIVMLRPAMVLALVMGADAFMPSLVSGHTLEISSVSALVRRLARLVALHLFACLLL